MSDSRVILITGANSGIGFELARTLAKKGHVVYVGARNEAAGKEAVDKLQADGLKTVKHVLIDVTKKDAIERTREVIENAEGKLDVLVNNAGISHIGKPQSALDVDISLIRETVETNLYGSIQTTQAFVPLLKKSSNPAILFVSTDMASNHYMANSKQPFHVTAYNTSKAALNSYAIALAYEVKDFGIKVNCVTPGFTSTKLNHFGAGGKSVEDGAQTLVPFVLLDKDGPTGKFFDERGAEFPW